MTQAELIHELNEIQEVCELENADLVWLRIDNLIRELKRESYLESK